MLNKYVSSVFKNHVYVDCLFLSCSIGSRTLIKFLLEKGLKPDALSRRQFTALHLAAYRVCLMKTQNATQLIVTVLPISWQNIIWKFLLVINFLCYLKNINNFKSEVLVTHFQYRIFTQSHAHIYDIDILWSLHLSLILLMSVLLVQGDAECVQCLLESPDTDVNLAGNSGLTALHIAAMCGFQEVCQQLASLFYHVVNNEKSLQLPVQYN